ncbi:MAG: LOG family protein [Candidatus Omnitrophota bacterium]|jgi:hypothetical protein
MSKNKMKKVCIFGSYKDLGARQKEDVFRLGQMLAQKGFTVVSGGFGGTMEDVSRGAKSAGGRTIGVTYYKWENPLYKTANKFIDKEIVARHLLDRIDIMVKKSDAFIVFPGGTGTLLELSTVLEYMNKGLSVWKPVIAVGDFWKKVPAVLKKEPVFSENVRNLRKISHCHELVIFVETVDDCVKYLGEANNRKIRRNF